MGKKNPIVHFEWRTRDTGRLTKFYGALFDWKFNEMMPGYTAVDTGNKEGGGGIMQIPDGQPIPTGTCNYVSVPDLDDAENKVKAAGGVILMSKQDVPGRGAFSVFNDPEGNTVGIWQPAAPPKKIKKAAKKAAKKLKKQAKKAKKGKG